MLDTITHNYKKYLYASARCKQPRGRSFHPIIGFLFCRVFDAIWLLPIRFLTDEPMMIEWLGRSTQQWAAELPQTMGSRDHYWHPARETIAPK